MLSRAVITATRGMAGLLKSVLAVSAMAGIAVSGLVSGEPLASAAGQQETPATTQTEQSNVGQKCLMCHEAEDGFVIDDREAHHASCVSCHSNPDLHLHSPTKDRIGLPQSTDCVSCHKNDRKLMHWAFSEHNKAGNNCTDCHAIHSSPAKLSERGLASHSDRVTERCEACHRDVAAQFSMRSHHPVREGGVTCTGCHDPHGGNRDLLLTASEQCLSCHQRLRGPMVFEHAPVVEDCTNCHAAHGSPNRALLSTSQPSVCLQCHSIATGKHGFGSTSEPAPMAGTRTVSGTVLGGCTNCHGAIHGSAQDPLLRY